MFKVADRLYLIGMERGVYLLDQGKLVRVPYFDHFHRKNDLGDFVAIPWRDNKALIITTSKGMFIHDTDRFLKASRVTGTPPMSHITPFKTDVDAYIQAHRIYCALRINDTQFALGTHGGGIVIIDDAGKLVRIINYNRGLADDIVLGIFPDNLGSFWALTNNGISHINLNFPVSVFDKKNGINANALHARRYKGTLFLGAFDGIYSLPKYKMNIENDIHTVEPVKGTENHYAFAMIIHQGILLSTLYHEIVQIEGLHSRSLITLPSQSIALNQSKKFPNIIFAGTGTGLLALKISISGPPASSGETSNGNSRFGSKKVSAEIIENKLINNLEGEFNSIAVDQKGDIWATSTKDSIVHLHWPGQTFDDLEIRTYGTNDGLPALGGYDVFNVDHHLFAGTFRGIYKYVPGEPFGGGQQRGRFVLETTLGNRLDERSGRILAIEKDADQNLWVACLKHFGKAIPNNAGDYHWDTRISNLFSGDTISDLHVDDDNVIWILASEGVYRYDTKIKKDFNQAYYTLIRKVIDSNQKVINGGAFVDYSTEKDGYYLDVSLIQSPEGAPRLRYQNNSIIFEYGAAYYEKPEKNQFRYRLEGFDKQWSQWTKEHKKEYTNLPEGKYRFAVQAKNTYEHLGQPAFFRFSILPPWYRTIWAYISYFLAGVLLLAGSVKLYAWRLIASRKKLQKIVKEKTSEVVKQKDEITKQRDQIEIANEALWGEMALAKKIQTVLLPTTPSIRGFEIAAHTTPADEVGGDYYDVINLDKQDWIVIGDVSGHGVSAGLVMMMVQTAIHSVVASLRDLSPTALLQTVNRVIYKNIQQMGENKYMTITVFSCTRDGTLQFAGLHQDIMIYRTAHKKVEQIQTSGMWIGVTDEISEMLKVEEIALNSGDVMLLYTDGITEAEDPNGQMLEMRGLAQAFSEFGDQSVVAIKDNILKLIADYTYDDDITLMVIKRQ
ncbi:MAG: SpoIIE family protein phosphatase [Myxococcota bacterium]|nr:SpoIIE family protein phosphatase [Myxococcota bacterium]